jgi:hypothetical protein
VPIKELVHITVEAKMTRHIPSKRGRHRRAGSGGQSEIESLRTKRAYDVSLCPKAEDTCLCSTVKQKGQIVLSSAFCSIQALNRLDSAHPNEWG